MARPRVVKTPAVSDPDATPDSRLQMADIARMSGVALSTVSRALSGSPLVNVETRTRIMELARSLGYTVNATAQNLRRQQNNTVALIVPFDRVSREHLSDPFFLSLIGSIADALTERGYEVLLSRVDDEQLSSAAQQYETRRAAGIILIGQWHHHDQLNEMAVRGVPLAVWGAQLPRQLYCTVGSDNVLGGRLATEHLLSQGCRQIAFIGDPALPEIGQRYQGYVEAHAARGLPVNPDLCSGSPFVRDAIQHDVERLVKNIPAVDGIFASSDLAAMTAIATLRRLGREVPRDVAVVGYDDIELAAFSHPPLSSVRQPIQAGGRALVALLIEQLEGRRPASVLLDTELVVRESSAKQTSLSDDSKCTT